MSPLASPLMPLSVTDKSRGPNTGRDVTHGDRRGPSRGGFSPNGARAGAGGVGGGGGGTAVVSTTTTMTSVSAWDSTAGSVGSPALGSPALHSPVALGAAGRVRTAHALERGDIIHDLSLTFAGSGGTRDMIAQLRCDASESASLLGCSASVASIHSRCGAGGAGGYGVSTSMGGLMGLDGKLLPPLLAPAADDSGRDTDNDGSDVCSKGDHHPRGNGDGGYARGLGGDTGAQSPHRHRIGAAAGGAAAVNSSGLSRHTVSPQLFDAVEGPSSIDRSINRSHRRRQAAGSKPPVALLNGSLV